MPEDIDREKARLTGLLDGARAQTHAALEGIDPARMVHPDTGWRAKDVVAHILVWEEEALRSLQALRGEPRDDQPYYVIHDFTDFADYNHADYERRRDMPLDQLLSDLHTVREDAKAILQALPPERFAAIMPFPWPQSGTLSQMMEIMAAHEREHAFEIARAGGSGGDS